MAQDRQHDQVGHSTSDELAAWQVSFAIVMVFM
jgi:hypothetical protein